MKLRLAPGSQSWLAHHLDGGTALSLWKTAPTTPVSARGPAGGHVHLRHRRFAGATAWRGDAMYDWRPREGGGA